MSRHKGSFVWHELMTTDAEAAARFYGDVVGWKSQDAGLSDRRYTIVSVGESGVGGIMDLPPEVAAAGARPGWIGYIGTDDVDSCAARVRDAGGVIHRPAEDIPGVGRFAVVADPQGAVFVLFKGAAEMPGERPGPGTPGTVGWNELHAGEWQSAFAFYADLFGWEKAEAVDMGPMGTYQLFSAGADPIGGMMTKTDAIPAPFWLYYFTVDAVDAGAARVNAKGGKVLFGPQEVPGGMWILQCMDPQGAMFALVAPRR